MISVDKSINLPHIDSDEKTILELKIPPFVGCFIADKNGKILVSFEKFEGALEYYIKKNLKGHGKKRLFDIELVSMFLSAIERLLDEINLDAVRNMKLYCESINMFTFFDIEQYTITIFTSPQIDISPEEEEIKNFCSNLFNEYKEEFEYFADFCCNHDSTLKELKMVGNEWLDTLNNEFTSLLIS